MTCPEGGKMPTGYTAVLMEKDETFKSFIMRCARAFGATIMMRDDSLDAPIPERFESSDYYIKQIEKSKKELIKLRSMNDLEKIIIFGRVEKDADIKQKEEWFTKEQTENKRLEDMEAQVKAWIPPTSEHQGLKDFMLNQIKISKNDLDYVQKALKEAKEKSPLAYYISALSGAERDIHYYTKENNKEIERTNSRNEWIQQLRASI